MIALPFIYFSIWFIVEYRKRGIDVYTFIISLYAIISFFSILVDRMNLYYDSCPKMSTLGIIAPIVYLFLLTICIRPLSKFRSNSIDKIIGNISERKFNFVVYVYFVAFLVILIVSATRLQEIFATNALAELREEQYQGDNVVFYSHLRGIPRYISAGCYLLSYSSFLMILFFYIGICHFKKGVTFSIITLCSSMSMLLVAINMADRSYFAYWGLTFLFGYLLFRKQFTKRTKKYFYILSLVLVFFMVIYLISVTVSRFEDSDRGSSTGTIAYFGMSYINFCNFFNYLTFDVPHKPEIVLFPNLNEYVLKGPNYFEYMKWLSSRYYHYNLSTFSTFIGFIMSVAGFWITLIYCLIYNMVARVSIYRPNLHQITLKRLILFWIIALNPLLGLFTYYYYSTMSILNIPIWIIIGAFLVAPVRRG